MFKYLPDYIEQTTINKISLPNKYIVTRVCQEFNCLVNIVFIDVSSRLMDANENTHNKYFIEFLLEICDLCLQQFFHRSLIYFIKYLAGYYIYLYTSWGNPLPWIYLWHINSVFPLPISYWRTFKLLRIFLFLLSAHFNL